MVGLTSCLNSKSPRANAKCEGPGNGPPVQPLASEGRLPPVALAGTGVPAYQRRATQVGHCFALLAVRLRLKR